MEDILIEEVRQYNFLYNIQDRDYRDHRKRQDAWEKIGERMNKTWQECRDDWSKLRNAYTNALKRRKTINGQSAKKIPKWKYEDQMSFLSGFIEPRPSLFSGRTQYDHSEINSNKQEPDKNVKEEMELQYDDIYEDHSFSNPLSDEAKDLDNYIKSDSLLTTASSINRIEDQMNELIDVVKSNNKRSQMLSTVQSDLSGDDIDLFFLSMAKSVKKLPVKDQVRLKIDISNLVFQAEMKKINTSIGADKSQSNSTNPSSKNAKVCKQSATSIYDNDGEDG